MEERQVWTTTIGEKLENLYNAEQKDNRWRNMREKCHKHERKIIYT